VSALLTILQHADSAFPSGSFAFSNGIEGLAALNAPLDRIGLRDIVAMVLQHRWATSDRVDAVEAATLAEPLRSGSKRNGNALLAAHARLGTARAGEFRARIGAEKLHGHLPVVQGFLWRARGMSETDAITVSGYTTASGLIAAAVRLGRIGAVEAQAVLTALLPTIAELSTPMAPDAEIESFLPWVDAAAARQGRAHLRLFAS
jgi:urease accessory protein